MSSIIGHGTINGEAGGSKGYIFKASADVYESLFKQALIV
jgi:hypothetical protein